MDFRVHLEVAQKNKTHAQNKSCVRLLRQGGRSTIPLFVPSHYPQRRQYYTTLSLGLQEEISPNCTFTVRRSAYICVVASEVWRSIFEMSFNG